jgi:hypothetical protein
MSDLPIDSGASVEERLLSLEERKVALEEHGQKDKVRDRKNEFLKTNLAALLAFLTSIASLFIAYRSVRINERAEDQRRELDLKKLDLDQRKLDLDGKKQDLELKKAAADETETDRKWHLEMLDFTAKNRALIFGTDEVAKKRISEIMLVTFPPNLVLRLFTKLEVVTPNSRAWSEGAKKAAEEVVRSPGAGGAMGTLGVFVKKKGTVVTLHMSADSDVRAYIAVVQRFPGAIQERWLPDQLKHAGGSFVVDSGTYTIRLTAVGASTTASIKASLTFSDGTKDERTIAVTGNEVSSAHWLVITDENLKPSTSAP